MPDQRWIIPERGERVNAELLKLLPRLRRRKIEMDERIQLASIAEPGRFDNSARQNGMDGRGGGLQAPKAGK